MGECRQAMARRAAWPPLLPFKVLHERRSIRDCRRRRARRASSESYDPCADSSSRRNNGRPADRSLSAARRRTASAFLSCRRSGDGEAARGSCGQDANICARRIRVTVGNMLAAARPAAQHIPCAHAKPVPGCTEFEQFLPGIAFPYGALADMFEPEPPPAVPRPNFGLQRLHTRIASDTSPDIRCRRRL